MSRDQSSRRNAVRWVAALILLLFVGQLVFAQSDAGAGALRGKVNSADGKPAANATVRVRNAETGYLRELQSDAAGSLSHRRCPWACTSFRPAQGEFKTVKWSHGYRRPDQHHDAGPEAQ